MLASRSRHERARREFEAHEHERQLATALADERRRLAGKLHDVAAHHLAGVVVQAAAVERLIRTPRASRPPSYVLRAKKRWQGCAPW
ncbi:MAG: histidine kinase [Propionibacteriaceae bacterium]|nr:histidine kinase [Propionibacteriaceae bacterium]